MASTRHIGDYKGGGSVTFCKGKHILLTSDLDMYIKIHIKTLTHFQLPREDGNHEAW